jgi:antitoxin (DNA-binding transcriptional repressor) of toxin-antitoxin stability system
MCYMTADDAPARVGVRELRQNLSVYLQRVKRGETLDVTERGHVVARLEPVPARATGPYERMKAEGRIRPAAIPWDEFPPPLELGPGPSLSEIIQQMRDEDDR